MKAVQQRALKDEVPLHFNVAELSQELEEEKEMQPENRSPPPRGGPLSNSYLARAQVNPPATWPLPDHTLMAPLDLFWHVKNLRLTSPQRGRGSMFY